MARGLAVMRALLLLGLLVIMGLLVALCASSGMTRLTGERVATIAHRGTPAWLYYRIHELHQVPGEVSRPLVISNTGLYPLVEADRESKNPIHQGLARAFGQVIRRVPLLRTDLGALQTLIAIALALLLGIAYAHAACRAKAADAAGSAAWSLRHQLHRQIYRLGRSALPGEGTGPAADLFARDVNEVRLGLLADLERSWSIPTLAVGLLVIGLVVSWQATVFLVALAALVNLVERPVLKRAAEDAEAAARDAAVRLLLLQEDLAMLRTVRVHGMEEIDRQRFDEHLGRYQEADARRLRAEVSPAPGVLLIRGMAAAIALGLLGYLVFRSRLSPAGAAVLLGVAVGMTGPLGAWLDLRKTLRQAGRSAEALFEYLEQRPDLQQTVGRNSWRRSRIGSASRTCRWTAPTAGLCSRACRWRSPHGPGRPSSAWTRPANTPWLA